MPNMYTLFFSKADWIQQFNYIPHFFFLPFFHFAELAWIDWESFKIRHSIPPSMHALTGVIFQRTWPRHPDQIFHCQGDEYYNLTNIFFSIAKLWNIRSGILQPSMKSDEVDFLSSIFSLKFSKNWSGLKWASCNSWKSLNSYLEPFLFLLLKCVRTKFCKQIPTKSLGILESSKCRLEKYVRIF